MKCGATVHVLHSADWDRYNAEDWSRRPDPADHVLWDEAIELGDQIEPLGFDSIWTTEHFGTPYGMVPNALQHLAFWAGRTQRVDMGTCVVVAPWHHPIQTAHEIAMLDILLQGRNYTIGFGRGLSPKEFDPLGIPRDEARQRFNELIEVVRLGLSQERFSYDGEIFKIPETSIRPQPRHADLWSGTIAAFMTDTSMEAIAKAGIGPIISAPQPYDKVGKTMEKFNAVRAGAGLTPDAQPTILVWAYCTETEAEAALGRKFFKRNELDSTLHYGTNDPKTFAGVKGYEQYAAAMADAASRGAGNGDAGFVPGGEIAGTFSVVDQQFIGTPDQVIEKATQLQKYTGCREVVVSFNYGAMPHELSLKSMQLFGREVLPAIQELSTPQLTTVA
jgi:alkanesulfonate monooxygenase SsuD/methylene tetrahydromethanopterin reductase-like flavin-dependent oxidoreductase (luciferase family)